VLGGGGVGVVLVVHGVVGGGGGGVLVVHGVDVVHLAARLLLLSAPASLTTIPSSGSAIAEVRSVAKATRRG